MRLTYQGQPRAGDIFNLYVTDVVGATRIEWFVDGNLINTTNCSAPRCDDRMLINSQFAGKELRITGTDASGPTEIRVQILGMIEINCGGRSPDMVPQKFPAIRDIMNRTEKVRFKTSNGDRARLHHTGTRARPGPIKVEIDGSEKGTIGTDGYFSPLPNIPLDVVETALREFNRNPRAAIEDYGRSTNTCAVCGRELTNPESIARGIGPICAGIIFP